MQTATFTAPSPAILAARLRLSRVAPMALRHDGDPAASAARARLAKIAPMALARDEGGYWRTMEGGAKVHFKGGVPDKGPSKVVDYLKQTAHRVGKMFGRESHTKAEAKGGSGSGTLETRNQPEKSGDPVGSKAPASGDPAGHHVGQDPHQPIGYRPHKAVPADIGKVNDRIDRHADFFRTKGQHEIAGWLDKLKSHVNTVGVEHALESLGESGGEHQGETQYQGVKDIGDFAEKYLSRAGISIVGDEAGNADAHTPVVSSQSPSEGGFVRKDKGDFFPIDPKTAKNKLIEAQSLPGLEKSEALPAGTTHLTPEVTAGFDKKFGKGKWIVKAYGDEAAAGYGIFFPQRAEQMRTDARSTIHSAVGEIKKYGFRFVRNRSGAIAGIRHENGDTYPFKSEKYASTINGSVREQADKVSAVAKNEMGAKLPGGGREFMVQPAFNVVGVSEADRAAGKTIAPGEGRVHVITRNGEAEIVPHSTWIKGEHLPVVFENDDTRAMAEAARDAISKLPEKDRQGSIYAPDIVKTDKGYKVVEANPTNHTGGSGYLGDNPMIIDSYVSHLTGRDPAHVKFIRKLLQKSATA